MNDLLEYVISASGCWSWWTQSNTIFQVEFDATQLNVSKGTVSEPPSHQIALRFDNPYSIAFIQRDYAIQGYPVNWMELLNKDKIEPFDISIDDFTLSDTNDFRRIMSEASEASLRLGDIDYENWLDDTNAFIAFWAGDVGLGLIAETMAVCSHEGELSEDIIESMNNDFWSYWENYWIKKESSRPLPYDYLCEAIVPEG